MRKKITKSLGTAMVAGSLALVGAATVGVAPANAAEQCNTCRRKSVEETTDERLALPPWQLVW